VRNRLRQRAIVSLLQANDSPPKILASQLFFLFDVEPHLDSITDNMTIEQVVMEVGNLLRSRQRLQEDVHTWARNLLDQAGLPFVGDSASGSMERDEPAAFHPGLSVVHSQTAPSKSPITQPRRSENPGAFTWNLPSSCLNGARTRIGAWWTQS
jgi:hypothetical protein